MQLIGFRRLAAVSVTVVLSLLVAGVPLSSATTADDLHENLDSTRNRLDDAEIGRAHV